MLPTTEEKQRVRDTFTIQTLGTGAADHKWGEYGREDVRGSTMTLLNGTVLLDAGATSWQALERFGIDPGVLTDLVFTHTHSDHFNPRAIRQIVEARWGDSEPLQIWVTPEGAGVLRKEMPESGYELHPMTWGDVFTAGGLRFTALPSNHRVEAFPREETFWYFIETPQGNLLYALDGAWLTTRGNALINRRKISWVVWDATMENAGDYRTFEHSDLTMLEMEIAALREWKEVDDSTLHIISHMARTLWPDMETSRRHAAARGFLMAYDGMKLEFPATPELQKAFPAVIPGTSSHEAILRLDDYFRNHMVLQRGRAVPVTGYARPGSCVTLTMGESRVRTFAGADGRFTLRLPPLEAADDLGMTVEAAGESIRLADISVGDVYLISGQSNMEASLADSVPGAEALTEEDFRRIRYLGLKKRTLYGPQRALSGRWSRVNASSASDISGIGTFFGCAVAKKTGVTVGLVSASIGGSNIEAWLSRGALLRISECRDEVEQYDNFICSTLAEGGEVSPEGRLNINECIKKLFPEIPDDEGEVKGYASDSFNDASWETMGLPDNWTQAGHNHAGIFWFRKRIELDAAAAEGAAVLHIGAVDKADRVFVNGHFVGATGDMRDMSKWNLLRVYPVPQGILRPGENIIAVQAGSMASTCLDGGLIGPAQEMYLEAGDKRIPLTGEWRYKETYDAGTIGMTFMRTLGPGASCSWHILYDNLIAPLAGIPMKGVLWYQGECNAICTTSTYQMLLEAMVDDWRRTFEDQNLPFYIFQLPEYGPAHHFAPYAQWPLIREAQIQACRKIGVDCVITLGCGDETALHPCNKREVALRAARLALARLRGETPQAAPALRSLVRKGATITLVFDGGPLTTTDGAAPGAFTLAGADGVCAAATARISGEHSLEVTAPGIGEPVSVWYAWADNPLGANLQDGAGNRVSPFRASVGGEKPVGRNLI